MDKLVTFLMVCVSVLCSFIIIALIIHLVLNVGNLGMLPTKGSSKSCEKAGGVYLHREWVCAKVDGSGYITNY